jgi:hypothetical protein
LCQRTFSEYVTKKRLIGAEGANKENCGSYRQPSTTRYL